METYLIQNYIQFDLQVKKVTLAILACKVKMVAKESVVKLAHLEDLEKEETLVFKAKLDWTADQVNNLEK